MTSQGEESSQGVRASAREHRAHPYRTQNRGRPLSHQRMSLCRNEILCTLKLLDVSYAMICCYARLLFVFCNCFKYVLTVKVQWVWV